MQKKLSRRHHRRFRSIIAYRARLEFAGARLEKGRVRAKNDDRWRRRRYNSV